MQALVCPGKQGILFDNLLMKLHIFPAKPPDITRLGQDHPHLHNFPRLHNKLIDMPLIDSSNDISRIEKTGYDDSNNRVIQLVDMG